MGIINKFRNFLLLAFFSLPVQAHHSFATHYIPSQPFELEGRVVSFNLRSPHSFMFLEAETLDGQMVQWEIEAAAAAHLQRMGVTRNTFQVGDQIKVIAWPNRQPDNPLIFGDAFIAANGDIFGDAPNLNLDKVEEGEAMDISMMSGRWQVPYPQRLNAPPMQLSDAGWTAWENYDPQKSPANTCERSTIPGIWYAPFLVDIRIDTNQVIFQFEHYAQTRQVPIGNDYSSADFKGVFGMSRSDIQDNVLTIYSHGYPASGWGLALAAQVGVDVPSSADKRITERFSVIDGGNTIILNFSIEDSLYLAEPYQKEIRLSRVRDDEPMFGFECELDSAERFSQ